MQEKITRKKGNRQYRAKNRRNTVNLYERMRENR